jgi:iron uptake system EfeUOB component EfeO/EfeM
MSARERLALLGDRADAMTKWQAQAEEDAEREAREKQEARGRASVSPTIATLQAEMIELRTYVAERDQEYLRITESLVKGIDAIESWVRKTIEARVLYSESQMCARIAESFGELRGWISAIDTARARAAKGDSFRFASEKDVGENDGEPVELPNPLPPRRAIN